MSRLPGLTVKRLEECSSLKTTFVAFNLGHHHLITKEIKTSKEVLLKYVISHKCLLFIDIFISSITKWWIGQGKGNILIHMKHLSSRLDELTVLVELGGHAHVAELVSDGDNHASDNSRVNLNNISFKLYSNRKVFKFSKWQKVLKQKVTLNNLWVHGTFR